MFTARPPWPNPSKSMPLMMTMSLTPALTLMPLPAETRMAAVVVSHSMVIALVIVTAPKPPGSRQLISPLAAVFEIAPAKVLHGAVRLHGLASSPTPEIQVFVACADAGAAKAIVPATAADA